MKAQETLRKERQESARRINQEVSRILKLSQISALKDKKEGLDVKRFAPSTRFVSQETKPRIPNKNRKDYLRVTISVLI